jgi:hypothetical protein
MQIDRPIGNLSVSPVQAGGSDARGGGTFQQTLRQLESGLRDNNLRSDSSAEPENRASPKYSASTSSPHGERCASGPSRLRELASGFPTGEIDNAASPPLCNKSSSESQAPIADAALTQPIAQDRSFASDTHRPDPVDMKTNSEIKPTLTTDMRSQEPMQAKSVAAAPKTTVIPAKTQMSAPQLTFAVVNGGGVITVRAASISTTDVKALYERMSVELSAYDTPLETLTINGHTTNIKQGRYDGHRRD